MPSTYKRKIKDVDKQTIWNEIKHCHLVVEGLKYFTVVKIEHKTKKGIIRWKR